MKNNADIRKFLVPFVFLLLILGGSLWSILSPKTEFSESENRYLEQMPGLSIESLKDRSFMEKYENYISDQFFLRNQWVALKTGIERLCLKEESNGVYFGKEDYLLGIPERQDYESELCKNNTGFLKLFMEKSAGELGSSHAKAVFVPTSSQVLKEKLPFLAAPYDQGILLNNLNDALPDGTFLSMLPVMEAHGSEDIYYRTDHHWTSLGAYYAYREWAGALGITPLDIEDFNVKNVTDSFQGTLQSKVNIDIKGEPIQIFEPKEDVSYHVTYNDNPKDIRDSLYDFNRLSTKSKYDVFFGGNQSTIKISPILPENSRIDKKEGNLLVVKDSFANCFLPFAALHYDNTFVIDLRYFNQPLSAYMKANGITDVLVLYSTYNFVSDMNLAKLNL